ncbi:MAG: hypothetical protein EOO90_05210 [Pedobacter sp.]|nr:MAG: hypothetical protein EOO90_05210 [Pedobacter sp.]
MSKNANSADKLTTIKFHFYTINFTPYAGKAMSSRDIMHDIITYIMQEKQKGKGYLVDKHKGRPGETARELFMARATFIAAKKRVLCSLALIRAGRLPMLKPAEEYKLIPMPSDIGSMAEETNVFIDYSTSKVVLCIEYNHNGPRLLDVEYYFRSIARDKLRIARVTEAVLHMDVSFEQAIDDLRNVLNIDIKLEPKKLKLLETDLTGQYFTGINSFGNLMAPKFVKVEALFQTPGAAIKSPLNTKANTMVVNLLKRFKKNPDNLKAFDNFVVKYEDKEGNEAIVNLLKGKREIVKEVDLAKIRKSREWYELIEADLDEFIGEL